MSGRPNIHNVEDVIHLDSDGASNNEREPQVADQNAAASGVVIGVPAEGYNVHQAHIITHNYYEKVQVDESGDV